MEETIEHEREVHSDANDVDLVTIFKHYDDDDNGSMDLNEARAALKDLMTVSKRAFQGYPAWENDDMCDEIITAQIKKIKALAPEGKEIRLDFPEFSTLATEYVRYSALSMIELKHRDKHYFSTKMGAEMDLIQVAHEVADHRRKSMSSVVHPVASGRVSPLNLPENETSP